jgi:anti-sigma regulatory factor (Ser/Thr protein kinase)
VGHGEFVETRRVLSRGSTLLLYTDGLVESSAQPVGVGISHLLQCLDAQKDIGDRRPEQLCDRVLGALLHGGGASDDTALLAVALDQHVDEVATPYLNAVLTGAQDLGELRRTVRRRCGLWQVTDDLADNALLVVTELATNALLHVGAPVTVTVRLQPGGLRVEVHDASSDRLPLPALSSLHTPSGDDLDAIVAELSGSGTTGRGMLLVSGLCDSWGVAAEPEGKTVWASLTTGSQGSTDSADPSGGTLVRLRGLPVRLVLASAAHVDGVVRELLTRVDDGQLSALGARGRALVEASARTRDPVRAAARDALARGQRLVDVTTVGTAELVDALVTLQELLEQLTQLSNEGLVMAVAPSPEVTAFRAWWRGEILSQLAGAAPVVCPFPAVPG